MSKILQIYFYVDFVAVAVSPKTIVSEPSFSLTISCNIRYVGLKLWDHSLAQWISSTQTIEIFLPNFCRSSVNRRSGVINRVFILPS